MYFEEVIKYKCGQCAETAATTFFWIAQNFHGLPFTIELINNTLQDHNYILLNRKEKSSINEPSTWGDACCLVDRWALQKGIVKTDNIKNFLSLSVSNRTREKAVHDDFNFAIKIPPRVPRLKIDLNKIGLKDLEQFFSCKNNQKNKSIPICVAMDEDYSPQRPGEKEKREATSWHFKQFYKDNLPEGLSRKELKVKRAELKKEFTESHKQRKKKIKYVHYNLS